MGRASLLGLCLNSLYKTDVWAYVLRLRPKPMHILFSTPSLKKTVPIPAVYKGISLSSLFDFLY